MKNYKLKDVIHHYIGCECFDEFNNCDIKLTLPSLYGYMKDLSPDEELQIKPKLRRLSDMTALELCAFGAIDKDSDDLKESIIIHSESTKWLIEQRFDLFGLIDSKQSYEIKIK